MEWCRWLAATSACGSSWTFLITFLQPKLSLRTQLMGLSPKYNDLELGRDMAWYARP